MSEGFLRSGIKKKRVSQKRRKKKKVSQKRRKKREGFSEAESRETTVLLFVSLSDVLMLEILSL